jgi:two-component system sensor histidine kinase YesM
MTARLNSSLEEFQAAARNAGYSITVQRFLLSNNPEIVIRNYTAALEHISGELNRTASCKNIFLRSAGGRYIRANRYRINEILEGTEAYAGADGVTLNRPFIDVLPAASEGPEGRNELYFFLPVYNVLWVNRTNEILCVAVGDMSGLTLGPRFLEWDSEGAVLLLYRNSLISSSRKITTEEQTALSGIAQGQSRVRIGGKRCLTIKVSLPETLSRISQSFLTESPAEQFWDYVYFVPESLVISRVFSQMNKGLPLLIAVVFFIAIIMVLIIHSVNTGVSHMVDDLNTLEYGRQPPLRKPHLKELELISHSVDVMLGRINNAVQREQEANEKLLDAVTAQARAEFMSYRSQINPHFLFNTLECMRSMAHQRGNENLETMISSMSRLFRYSLYAKPMVSLALELDHVRNYMRVMNIRSGSRYHLNIMADRSAEDRELPSMILQPLVENSITHGFADRAGGVILILARIVEDDGTLLLRLVDNGNGIGGEDLAALREKLICPNDEGRSALHNIRRRMRLSFGESFSLDISSKQGHYTRVEMLIPGKAELALPEIK